MDELLQVIAEKLKSTDDGMNLLQQICDRVVNVLYPNHQESYAFNLLGWPCIINQNGL